MPDKQFMLYLDDVRLPADALIGDEDAALAQLFAGLNPERIMAAAGSVGMGRYALDKAVAYANQREVWGKPIGTHQGLSHPLAKCKVELELSKLMMQKAATLYDAATMGAGEAANMAKYAAAEASIACVDQAIQTHGGNGLAHEYGFGNLLIGARVGTHRAGEPRDDPQLRRPVQPRPAEVATEFTKLSHDTHPSSHAATIDRSIATVARRPRQPQRAVEAARDRGRRAPAAAASRRGRAGGGADPHRTTFCAGADLKEQAGEGGPAEGTTRMLGLLRSIVELPKPVLARVDGHVRAGGVGLVGACDIVLAGPATTFAFTEVRLGLAPAIISLTTRSRMTDRGVSRYYLTGETFDAQVAATPGW